MYVCFGELGHGQSCLYSAVIGACNTPAATILNETTTSKYSEVTTLCKYHLLTKKEKLCCI